MVVQGPWGVHEGGSYRSRGNYFIITIISYIKKDKMYACFVYWFCAICTRQGKFLSGEGPSPSEHFVPDSINSSWVPVTTTACRGIKPPWIQSSFGLVQGGSKLKQKPAHLSITYQSFATMLPPHMHKTTKSINTAGTKQTNKKTAKLPFFSISSCTGKINPWYPRKQSNNTTKTNRVGLEIFHISRLTWSVYCQQISYINIHTYSCVTTRSLSDVSCPHRDETLKLRFGSEGMTHLKWHSSFRAVIWTLGSQYRMLIWWLCIHCALSNITRISYQSLQSGTTSELEVTACPV